MKMIVAVIQPEKLDDVREALSQKEVSRLTVNHVSGHGQAKETDLYRGKKVIPALTPKVRLEIACNDNFVEPIVTAIQEAAKNESGEAGAGKIFIMHLEDCIRIRTGERGQSAI